MKQDLPLLTITSPNAKHLPIDTIVKWNMSTKIEVRATGEFEGRAFYLDPKYNWVAGYDSFGLKILVATLPLEDENPEGTLSSVG